MKIVLYCMIESQKVLEHCPGMASGGRSRWAPSLQGKWKTCTLSHSVGGRRKNGGNQERGFPFAFKWKIHSANASLRQNLRNLNKNFHFFHSTLFGDDSPVPKCWFFQPCSAARRVELAPPTIPPPATPVWTFLVKIQGIWYLCYQF